MMAFKVVFGKEFRDGLRDRRAVLSALIFPLLAPFLVYFLISTMIDLRSQDKEIEVAVQGADNAPHLIAWLVEKGLTFSSSEGDARALVSSQQQELVMIIPEN
jgi:sodium transport system permease protein